MGTQWLILGAGGMLGRAWAASLQDERDVRLAARFDCDITDESAVREFVTPDVGVVVNCAAYTDVDGAESNEDLATLINGKAIGILAQRCADVGATLVTYSTDYVFNGQATRPYPTTQQRDPINAYGRSKAAGEEILESHEVENLLLRTSWLYDSHGKNFVRTIASACRERDELRVVEDQRGRPTSCRQLVSTSRALLEAGARGVLHASDSGDCTWFDLAAAIADRLNPQCVVEPCSSDEFPRPATRPAYSVLDLSNTESIIGPIPHWRRSLDAVLTTIEGGLGEPAAGLGS